MTAVAHLQTPESYLAYCTMRAQDKRIHVPRWGRTRMSHFRPARGDTILDLGCGSGGNLVIYGGKCEVVGVELTKELVNTARRVLAARGLFSSVDVVHSPIETFVSPQRFDHVLLTEVLEHVIDPVVVLRVAREHLAEDGEVYISAPAVKIGGIGHVRGVPYEDLKGWLVEAGLRSRWHIEQPNKQGACYQQTVCKAVAA